MKRGEIEDRCRSQNNYKTDLKKMMASCEVDYASAVQGLGFVYLILSFRVECEVPGLHCLAECPTASIKAFCTMEL